MRSDDEMAALLHRSINAQIGAAGPILESTTCHQDDGEFEVVTSRPRLSENLPNVKREDPLCQLGMVSHKNPLITIFGLKHKIKNFIKKFDMFHKKDQQPSILDFLVYIWNKIANL